MKICLINNLYKPYARGGAERVVELVVDGLQKDGHEVVIITTRPFFIKRRTESKKQKIYYISSLYFNLNKMPKFLRLFWHFIDMFDIGSYLRVRSILKKEQPETVMTHNLKGIGFLILRAIKSLKIKHIHTLHDIQLLHPSGLMLYGKEQKINNIFSKIYQNLCGWLFGSPDTVISPSKWLMGEHTGREFFRDSRKVVMPNPVVNMEHETRNIKHKNKIFRFLYVGLIEEHKGVLFLIKAFKRFSQGFLIGYRTPYRVSDTQTEDTQTEYELIIAGDGAKFKKAHKLIGRNKNIKLLGRIDNSEVKKIMGEADALIMPSLCYENSPSVIYEAMGAGLPIIASRIGGIPELLSGGRGLLFEPNNQYDLIHCMEWVIKYRDELRKMGERGKRKAKEFEVENYVKRLVELL
jgi:glycosyltransferase involved in cell wall biosynthesis